MATSRSFFQQVLSSGLPAAIDGVFPTKAAPITGNQFTERVAPQDTAPGSVAATAKDEIIDGVDNRVLFAGGAAVILVLVIALRR